MRVRKHIIDSLTAGAVPVTGVVVAYQHEKNLAEAIARLLPYPTVVVDPVGSRLAPGDMAMYGISHAIEVYHPKQGNYLPYKQYRQQFWKQQVQVLSLLDWTEEYLADDFWGTVDYIDLAQDIAELAKQFAKVKTFRITSELGTNISFSTAGRSWRSGDGLCRSGEQFAQLPDGEIFTCPVEETFNGVIVVDGTVTRDWVPAKPLRLEFEKGRLVNCPPEFRDYIKDFPEGINTIGEFAVGLNRDIYRMTGNISVDEKAAGTIHFALGDSYGLGRNKADCHLDFVVTDPSVDIEPQVDLGKWRGGGRH